jgi:S1-C subfamily serine protease
LEKGEGMRKDAKESAYWLAEAADSGISEYEVAAAWSFQEDGAVPADTRRAFVWMRDAAGAGLSVAQAELARYYATGIGVARDEVQSVFWLRRAASQGDARSFLMLGHVYRRGFADVPRALVAAKLNPILATAMYRLANRLGDAAVRGEASKNLAEMKSTLAQIDQQAGEDFALLWRPGVDMVEQMDLIRTSLTAGKEVGVLLGANQGSPSKLTATGSGFFVSTDGAVLTNRHVVEGCKAIRVLPLGVQSRKITVSATEDLALVFLEEQTDNFARLSPRGWEDLGEPVLTAGFPLRFVLDNGVSITSGMVSASGGSDGSRNRFQITAAIQPGNSGGPVLDLFGNVIGVVVSKLNPDAVGTEVEGVNYAVSLTQLRNFLRQSGVAIDRGAINVKELSSKAIARSAEQFTVSLECWE